MLKKRILAGLLAITLLFFTACGNNTETKEWLMQELELDDEQLTGAGIQECTDGVVLMGDTESEDPLRICIDLPNLSTSDSMGEISALKDFLSRLRGTVGLEDVVIEIIPTTDDIVVLKEVNAARSAAIERIQSEILNGGGPDVFIAQYQMGLDAGTFLADYDIPSCLFEYPGKAMEYGRFLPLDEYIENNTVLTEWDKLTQPVLEAGRNWEGQQIIPLNYTMPLLCCPKAVWEHVPDKRYTWNDMLTNPELLPYSRDMANFGYAVHAHGSDETVFVEGTLMGMNLLYGDIIDYESEKLIVTEEELVNTMEQILSLDQKDSYMGIEQAEEIEACEVQMRTEHINKPMTFLPLYNMKGGVTVEIEKYAAVNRNTKRPEDAFKVIDLLMSKNFQQSSFLYNQLICRGWSMPLHEELFQKSTPVGGMGGYMLDSNFEAFSKVREQITDAYFMSEGSRMLRMILLKCRRRNEDEPEKDVKEIIEETVRETYIALEKSLHE